MQGPQEAEYSRATLSSKACAGEATTQWQAGPHMAKTPLATTEYSAQKPSLHLGTSQWGAPGRRHTFSLCGSLQNTWYHDTSEMHFFGGCRQPTPSAGARARPPDWNLACMTYIMLYFSVRLLMRK